MRYQGHSHVNMGVAPSTTDYDYYRGVIKNTGKGIQVFGIFNKKEDMIHMIIDIDTQEVYVPKVIIPPTQFHDILNDIKDNISSIKYVAPKNTNFFKKRLKEVIMNIQKHIEFFNPQEIDKNIHIIGIGALGSTLVENLTRLGISKLYLYDYDVVNEHNIANQMFFTQDIGEEKSKCVRKNG